MADYPECMLKIRTLKGMLPYGGQRELARRMDVSPERISYALSGFTKDLEFLNRLVNEMKKLIQDRSLQPT